MNYKLMKYNVVKCCCDKIFVNVATHVIPGYVCVCECVWCGVNRNLFTAHARTHTHTPP